MVNNPLPPEFHVLIPARLASSRLPNKPLADIAGLPMVVRVAQRAALSHPTSCTVATDDRQILEACRAAGVAAVMTSVDHLSGSDRLAEACHQLGLPDEAIVVNLQGDEPLMDPDLVAQVAKTLQARPDCVMSTAAHTLESTTDFLNPNVVKVVTDRQGTALYFSRAPIPWWRDGMAALSTDTGADSPVAWGPAAPKRHIGIYAYRVGFLKHYPLLQAAPEELSESLEQLRVLWHGHRIAVHLAAHPPGPGVDTPEDLARVRALFEPAA